jgi:hypothetical protein
MFGVFYLKKDILIHIEWLMKIYLNQIITIFLEPLRDIIELSLIMILNIN